MTDSPDTLNRATLAPLDFDPKTLSLRMNRALTYSGPVDPYALVEYEGETMRIMNLPTQELRAMMGFGHTSYDMRTRNIHKRPDGKEWPWRPENCRVADGHRGVWINESTLTCPGCGMDFT